jgi:hypothetical protein
MPTLRPRRDLLGLTVLCVLLLSLAFATSCAGGGEAEQPPDVNGAAPATGAADSSKTAPAAPEGDATVSSSSEEEEAREVAEKVLLTLRDLPAGWSQLPPNDEEKQFLDVPPECQTFSVNFQWPGTVAEADSPEFEGPDRETVGSSATIFVDAEAAVQAFARYKAEFELCREPVRTAFMKDYEEGLRAELPDTNVAVTAFAMDWLSFPRYGDESAAARMSVSLVIGDRTIDMYIDFIVWRVGRIEGGMSFSTLNEVPDLEEEQRVAKIIDERLREAAEELD